MQSTSPHAIPLIAIDDLEERSAKGFEIDGESVFALKFDGELRVYRNSCPHLGVELNWLEDQFFDMDGALVQCATHGAVFDPLTGLCLAGPCRGQSLQRLDTHVANGQLHLNLAPPTQS